MPASSVPFAARISALQTALTEHGLDACLVFSADPHLSEYLPEHWQTRAWLSGFNGSAGTLAVTRTQAALWTDSRYWEQAANTLAGTGIALMKTGTPDVPQPVQWLVEGLPKSARVALDGMTVSVSMMQEAQKSFSKADMQWVTDADVIGQIWTNRPPLPHAPIFEHPMPFACRTRAEKLAAVRQRMQNENADWHWICALDDVAWLLNLRGADVPYNPVFLAHLLLGQRDEQLFAQLFVDPAKINPALAAELLKDGVTLHPYEDAQTALQALPAQAVVLFDPDKVVAGMTHGMQAQALHAPNPCQLLKACKTDAELDFIRATTN